MYGYIASNAIRWSLPYIIRSSYLLDFCHMNVKDIVCQHIRYLYMHSNKLLDNIVMEQWTLPPVVTRGARELSSGQLVPAGTWIFDGSGSGRNRRRMYGWKRTLLSSLLFYYYYYYYYHNILPGGLNRNAIFSRALIKVLNK